MRNFDFSGPYLKIERADKHIREVETLLERYVKDNKRRFSPKNQRQALRSGRTIHDVKPPKHFSTALGDAVHNLRASLDHAYCILVQANGHTLTDRTSFPINRKDRASMDGSIVGEMRAGNGPSEIVRDFIGSEVQSYPGGKYKLLELHELDVIDKHLCILPTSADVHMRNVKLVEPNTGRVEMSNLTVQAGDCGGANFRVAGYLLETEGDLQSAFDVTFGEGQPLTGERIVPTLFLLRDNVVLCLNGLEKLI